MDPFGDLQYHPDDADKKALEELDRHLDRIVAGNTDEVLNELERQSKQFDECVEERSKRAKAQKNG